jgi:hypothetical protein
MKMNCIFIMCIIINRNILVVVSEISFNRPILQLGMMLGARANF